MRKECFGYKASYANGCSVLKGAVECERCKFYKTKREYNEGLLSLSSQEDWRSEIIQRKYKNGK